MEKEELNLAQKSHEKHEIGVFEFNLGNTILNVEITIKEGHPNEPVVTSLVLDNRKGKTISILSLLPVGWEVMLYSMPSLSAKARLVERQIILPQNYVRDSYEDVVEGESPENIKVETKDLFFGSLLYRRDLLKEKNKVQIVERVPIFDNNPNVFITLLHEIGHILHPNNDSLPEDWQDRIDHLWSKPNREGLARVPEERDAWSFAIKTLRKLRDDGFDFGDAFTRQHISDIVDYPLATYGDPKKQKR